MNMKDRHRIEQPVAPRLDREASALSSESEEPFARREPVIVRDQTAFWLPGRAGRIENRGLGRAVERLRCCAVSGGRQALGSLAGFDDGKRPFQLGCNGLQTLDMMAERDREHRAAMGHLVAQLRMPVVGVNGHDAGPHGIERKQMDEKVRPVFKQQGDAMSRPVPRLLETPGERQDALHYIGVGPLEAIRRIGSASRDADECIVRAPQPHSPATPQKWSRPFRRGLPGAPVVCRSARRRAVRRPCRRQMSRSVCNSTRTRSDRTQASPRRALF